MSEPNGPGLRAAGPLLEVRDLVVHHGQLKALSGISLAVYPGEVYAIIGANGAGKSTLLRTIAGLHHPTEGTISYEGRDITGLRPEKRATAGIGMVPEGRRLFPSLTLEENLKVGATYARKGPWTIERVFELFPWMKDRRGQKTAQMSGGEQQSVAIGRALVANPQVLLLDELSLGLAPVIVQRIYAMLPQILELRRHRAAGRAGRQPGAPGRDAPAVPARGAHHAGRHPGRGHPRPGRGGLLRSHRWEQPLMAWVNAVIQGILTGGLYALFACGLSLLFGVMKVVNLAHGDLATVAGYVGVGVVAAIHLPFLWSVPVVVLAMAVLGYVLQRSVIQAALSRGELTTLIVTFGLSIVIENGLLQFFTSDSRGLAVGDSFTTASFSIGSQITIAWLDVYIFILAVAVLLALQYFLTGSKYGRLIRAVADDREAAQLSGADYRHVFGIAAAIAFGTVALAGMSYGLTTTIDPTTGTDTILLFAFAAVVIGGLGSLWGTLLGGIVLGVAQQIGAQINISYEQLGGYVIFLLVLVVWPQGLTGRRAQS